MLKKSDSNSEKILTDLKEMYKKRYNDNIDGIAIDSEFLQEITNYITDNIKITNWREVIQDGRNNL